MGECSELGSWDLRSFILLTMDYIHTSEEHNKQRVRFAAAEQFYPLQQNRMLLLILTLALSLLAPTASQSPCPANCSFCVSFSICQQCSHPFNLFTNNTCIPSPPILGCQLYTLDNTCARCLDSYMIYHGECYPPVGYCTTYTSAGRCQRCLSNYLLFEGECFQQGRSSCPQGLTTYNNSCVQIDILNCLQFSSGICNKCSLEYSLLNGLCILLKSTNSCLSVNPNNTCASCMSDEYLFGGVCGSVFLDNCGQRVGFVCQLCNGTDYVLSKGACRRREIQSDPYCLFKDLETGKCVRCLFNYYLNQHRVCVRVNSGCATNDSAGNCLSCTDPLLLVGNACVYSDSNCLQPHFETRTCRICKPGYQLQTNGRLCRVIQPCITTVTNGSGCLQCVGGYKLINTSCYLIPKNCVDLDTDGSSCRVCSNDTTLFNGICVYPHPQCIVYQRQTGYCIKCSKHYTLCRKGCIPLPPNCTQVNNKYQCLSCQIGYQLRNRLCIKIIQNCLFYLNSSCIQCQWYYYVGNAGSTCEQYPSLCNMVDNNGLCISCQEGLTLYFGKCVFYQTFCTEYSSEQGTSGNCIRVQKTFFLTNNYVIGSRVADYWDSRGNILSCKGYLTLKGEVCTNIIIGCSAYDQLSNCQQCSKGFALILNQCILDTNICVNRTGSGCVQCIGGFVAFNGTCFSYQNNADQWDISGRPIKASDGYIITSLGMAYSLPFNCLIFNISTQLCTQCQTGFTIRNQRCVISVPDCTGYNQRGICQSCSGGLRMINGMCRNASMCETSNDNQCLSCVEGARLMSGICVINFKELNCLVFTPNFACLQCRNGYYLMQDQCRLKPVNCLEVNSSSGVCILCSCGFRLHNMSCLPQQLNCQSYLPTTGLCSVCSPGYTLLKNSTCYLIPPLCLTINPNTLRCMSCQTSYNVLVYNETRCANLVPNCFKFYLDGYCAECQSNYSLVDGECVSRAGCANSGFRMVNGTCVKKTPNCLRYSGMRCDTCERGYYLTLEFSCNQNPIGCLNYLLAFGCTQCLTGYSLQGSACQRSVTSTPTPTPSPIQNCTTLINNICQQCLPTHILQQNKCFKQLQQCSTYSSTGICLACRKGYYLNRTKRCTSLPNNCYQSNPFGICLTCNPNYMLIQNLCLMNVTDCISFDTLSGACVKCRDNLVLTNGRQCARCPDNTKLVGNSCVPANMNCQIMSSNGSCLYCNDGFTLSNGSCVRSQKQPDNILLVQNSVWPYNIIVNSNCPDNYYLVQGHCYKNISFTYPVSTISSATLVYSSISKLIPLPCFPRIGSVNWWQANRNAPDQWVGYSFPTTFRIQSIQIQGNGVNSLIQTLILKHKPSPSNSSLQCLNNCQPLNGSKGINDILTISFENPIITRELRIYPQEWTGQIAMRFQFLSD